MTRTGTSVYPGGIDSFVRVGTTNYEDEVGYEIVNIENEAMDALEHIEAVIGTTTGTSVFKNVLAGQFVATTAGTETFTNKTFTAPVVNGAITGDAISTGTTVNIGTANDEFVTPKALADSNIYINKVHQIYTLGDSLTFNGTYQTMLESLLGGSWNTIVLGIGGDTTTGMLSRLYGEAISKSNAEYLIVWGGINDVVADVASATIESNLQAIYTAAHDAGIKVVSINITPFKTSGAWTAGRQAVLDDVNTWIASSATGIDYKIDAYSVLEDPVAPDTLLVTYDFGDHLHLSTAGYNLVGTTVYNGTTWIMSDNGLIENSALDEPLTNFSMARQALVNSNFDVWQRGTSFTNPADAYTADRWQELSQLDGGTAPTIILSRQTLTSGDIPNSFYHYRFNPSGAGSGYGTNSYYFLVQKIEHGTRFLCGTGKKVTVSFWAKSDIADKKVGVTLLQNYGTGGSPYGPEIINGASFSLTSSWAKYTHTFTTFNLTGRTFGTANNDSLQFCLFTQWGATIGTNWVNDGVAESWGGSGNIDIAQTQLCAGDVALPFMPKNYNQELLDCQAFRWDAVVRTINGIMYYSFPTTMRTTPTTLTASAGTIANGTKDGFQITHNANADSTIVADAEL